MTSDSDTAILVVGHGTKSRHGIEQFNTVIDLLKDHTRFPVGQAFIEFAEPDIQNGVANLVALAKPKKIIVVPLLLLAAGHVKNDVPFGITKARVAYKKIIFHYARDLSITPALLDIVEDRALHPFSDMKPLVGLRSQPEFTLLVGRGSSDPDANSDLYKIARLLSERGRLGQVEPAFISLAKPGVPESLDKLRLLGANRITVAPYFLFTGTLLERIYSQSRAWQNSNPAISVQLAREMGPDPRIVELINQRVTETQTAESVMNCDMCIYRRPIQVHDHATSEDLMAVTHQH
ncbi:MAG: sirohydrochlorin chelatase [Actinomycetota bacterium]|nr:MAG: sirohydrochlorin chelatase [Actinomycetota bacterium]